MSDFDFAAARQALADQPFSRLIGTEFVAFEPGRAVLAVELRDELRQQHGFAHGGLIAYLADNAIGFAGGSVLGALILTAGMTIDYIRPVADGALQAEALVVTSTRRTASCRVEITAGGKVVAVAQGMVRAVEVPAA